MITAEENIKRWNKAVAAGKKYKIFDEEGQIIKGELEGPNSPTINLGFVMVAAQLPFNRVYLHLEAIKNNDLNSPYFEKDFPDIAGGEQRKIYKKGLFSKAKYIGSDLSIVNLDAVNYDAIMLKLANKVWGKDE